MTKPFCAGEKGSQNLGGNSPVAVEGEIVTQDGMDSRLLRSSERDRLSKCQLRKFTRQTTPCAAPQVRVLEHHAPVGTILLHGIFYRVIDNTVKPLDRLNAGT